MLLAIDVGNTNTVVGIFDGEQLKSDFRIRTMREITEDEIYGATHRLMKARGFSEDKITDVIVASVVPKMKRAISVYCSKYLKINPLWVTADLPLGMPVLLKNPAEAGADRIVNAVAAYDKYKGALIVVDFGTATTFDCISKNGEYLGGAISPGIGTASEALFTKAARLPRVEIADPPQAAIGRDTVSSMQSGIIFGYAGLVDGLVSRIKKEMDGPVTVIATGGLAPLMAGVCSEISAVEPDLTLLGLRLIHQRIRG